MYRIIAQSSINVEHHQSTNQNLDQKERSIPKNFLISSLATSNPTLIGRVDLILSTHYEYQHR